MGYVVGEKIVVVSSHISGNKTSQKYSICKVLAVGAYDLICERPGSFTFHKIFKVSKKRCAKIKVTCDYDEHRTIEPKIGDLVLSVTERYDHDPEHVTGIVEKISYDPIDQQNLIYYVRTGQKLEKCYLNNMIILERN